MFPWPANRALERPFSFLRSCPILPVCAGRHAAGPRLQGEIMRRDEREIRDRAEIDAILRRSRVCRLGLSDDGQPYVVPLCFGYDGRSLYFHCAREGRKLEILRRESRVCVEFDELAGLVDAPAACGWAARYRSAIGFGTAHEVEDADEKARALALLMRQYAEGEFPFDPGAVERTVVVRVDLESLTGKASWREA